MARGVRGRPPATTHDDIRRTAMRLFAEQGYGATSLAQIAQASGVSRTTLFAYFPAKRDLVWRELHETLTDLPRLFDATHDLPVVDLIAEALYEIPRHTRLKRIDLAERWAMVTSDHELRGHVLAEANTIAEALVDCVGRRSPDLDGVLVDHVVRSLLAVVGRCIEEWGARAFDDVDLVDYTRGHLEPFVKTLRPLLA